MKNIRKSYLQNYPQVACYSHDLISTAIALHGRYENNELEFLSENLFPSLQHRRICLDIGANIGNHSLAFAEHFASVHAFELHPKTFKLLSINAELNAAIYPRNIGVSDKCGELEGRGAPSSLGSFSLSEQAGSHHGDFMKVKIDRLDNLLTREEMACVDFIKMDIEGHEAAALRGASELLQNHAPVVAMEIDRKSVSNGQSEATQIIKQYGYHHTYQIADGTLPRPLRKLLNCLEPVFTSRLHQPNMNLLPMKELNSQSHHMAIFSKYELL